jgi:hypothetical protein
MIIGVPLIAVIYDLVKKVVKRGLRRNGYPDMYDTYAAEFNPPSEPQEAEEEECEENSETPDSTAK